jgi:hypothetical protein
MYLRKVIGRKTFVKKFFLIGVLKVNDENSRIRIRSPLVRGMDPWIRIRIHTKMSWIRNTALKALNMYCFVIKKPIAMVDEMRKMF